MELLDICYHLTINDVQLGAFYKLSGGEAEISVIRYPTVYSTGEATTLLIPGAVTFSPITLSRGYGNSAELYNWFVLAATGNIAKARKHGAITLNGFVDGTYKPLVQWNLENTWPTKIAGFEGDQYSSPNTAKLSLTLVAELIERKDVS
jgi:phage tail-like protein